ncbi:MAG: GNAT family N-acetyltransferase [Chryseobacterium gambrini]|nr:GNAT family N-acetyltransferase [Chryseobacterium gambrini]
MIDLKTLNRKKLEEFISSGDYKKYDFLPITKHRAISHLRNPKAGDEDVLLILAFHNDQLAGYLGCFPDHFIIDGKPFKYAWLSTLFISNEFRGKKIAQTLLNTAFEEYDGNIAITEFTKEAESLYNKIGLFRYIQPKRGKRYYFKADFATIIPSKKSDLKSFQPVFKIADSFINTLLSFRKIFTQKPDFKFEISDKIDAESSAFLLAFKSNRTPDEINWFIENPWVLENENTEKDYLFSAYSKQFRYFWIKIYDENNNLETCSLLLLRDGTLKVLYLFSKTELKKFVVFLNDFIVKNKVKILTNYHIALNENIASSKQFQKIYQKDFERRYMFHKNLLANLPKDFNPDFQDGDGDCAMT